ncbi:TadE/TadG family type IV pilus assembly protein [Rhizobium halophytocola]|uniref:Flp pilus assembly protein TadG n=1 Tax=Rhizobium halophytocola TaxID=735519 RepID=A0ABS4DYG7_9HYPH|nr:TadE/TadG family type IV pilus assembly protein [Rhizobium halophytocola]MBP1850739.1 Flp pilus assembly protein TadG [Rhizobium halophytocola]
MPNSIIHCRRLILQLWHDRRGNFAISFAILLVPVLTAVGMSLDYVRAYNVRTKMQADLDTALIAAVKSVGTKDTNLVQQKMKSWFAAQTDQTGKGYTLSDIEIGANNNELTATARVAVQTTVLQIAGFKKVDVGVASSVAGPTKEYINVYFAIDKSASMMLAATPAGQAAMFGAPAYCAFACHEVEGGPYKYKGKSYTTNYALARAMGVQLRTDVAINAVNQVLDMVEAANLETQHIKVGLYTVGQSGSQVLAPTFSVSDARKKLSDDSAGFNAATSQPATYFDYSLADLSKFVGTGGDGSVNNPSKLVLLLTDGLQSERNWVHDTSSGIRFPTTVGKLTTATTPLNPDWCKQIKNDGSSFGVLYTTYLPLAGDWGYDRTAGQTMKSSGFKSIWGGTWASGYGNWTRQAYLPVALKSCASASNLFIQADSASEIEKGLGQLFQQYMSKVRLIN